MKVEFAKANAKPKIKRKSSFGGSAQLNGILFALPAILGFLIFVLGPMIASLIYSFTDYSVFKDETKFIGFENFITMFSGEDPFFYKSLGVTFYYVFLSVPIGIAFAFFLAILLNTKIKGRAIFRTIFYLPSIVPVVASAMIWLWLFNPDLGLINNVLSSLGLPTGLWLFSEKTVIPSIVLMGLWGVGGNMIIFLAGLNGIPEHYYEAIEVDGGNTFRKFWHITIPMMTPTIFFTSVMGLIGSFQVFTEAYVLTGGGPNNASLFYVFYIWREAFANSNMGFASALAWVLFVIIMLFTLLVFKTSKWVYYEGGGRSN
jgi:multiple sugar transport system permease protein